MRGSKCWLLFAALACLSTFHARPCAALTLTVEREPGTEACPDEAGLRTRVREVRGPEVEGGSSAYAVRFKHSGKGLSAEIRVGQASVRTLDTRTTSCEVLAKGVAVTLAMLIDSDAAAQPSAAPPVAAAPAPAQPPESPTPVLAPPHARRAVRGFFALGAGGLVGVLGPIDPAFTLEGGLRSGTVRAGLGAIVGMPRQLDVAAGSVTESLFAATLRACAGLVGGERLNLGLCAGAFAGELGGSARGFAAVQAHHRAWLVLPVELSLARSLAPVGWELSASALLPVVQRDFGIAGVGVAYRTPAIAGLFTLRGVLWP